MADNTIKIGGELESMATGKIVAAASSIKDKSRNKTQEVINGDVEAAIAEQSAQFEALSEETSEAVAFASKSAEDAKQYLADLQEAITELPDGQAVSAQVAVNEVDIAGLKSDVVVDLSVRYATSYANLSAALIALNSDTATDATTIKKAGVSIKFINSGTGKYEQWNLKVSSWSINTYNWAKAVDSTDIPIDKIESGRTQSEEDALVFKTDGGVEVGKIDANGADFINLKREGQQVARMSDLPTVPTLDTSIGDTPSPTNVPTTKAVKDYVDAKQIDLPITEETTASGDEEMDFTNDAGSQSYAKVGSYGVKSKAYLDMNGNDVIPTIDMTIDNAPTDTNVPSTKAVKNYVDNNIPDYPISEEATQSSDEELIFGNDAGTQEYAKVSAEGIRSVAYMDMQGNSVIPVKDNVTNILTPPVIYTVCNDVSRARNYSVKMFVDHLFYKITKNYRFRFTNGRNQIPFYSKINDYKNITNSTAANTTLDIHTITINDVISGDNLQPIPVSFTHISTRNLATVNSKVRLLCIGDSVTQGYLAGEGRPYTRAPQAYWSWVKALFEMDKKENNNSGFFFESLGNVSGLGNTGLNFDINFDGLQIDNVDAFACGVGGTKTTDWISAQLNNDGRYRINPFYDVTNERFSLRYWVEHYRTLTVNNDGTTTRCDNSNKGDLAPSDTTVNNVCEPTHVLIQLGYNQLYQTNNSVRTNYLSELRLMIDTITEEYPDIFVMLSLPDTTGTYTPECWEEYMDEGVDIYNYNFARNNTTAKYTHDCIAYMNADLIALQSEYANVIYVPTYFAFPSCYGGASRKAKEVSYYAINTPALDLRILQGGNPNLHPNNAAHADIAYQIYSAIKFTLINNN